MGPTVFSMSSADSGDSGCLEHRERSRAGFDLSLKAMFLLFLATILAPEAPGFLGMLSRRFWQASRRLGFLLLAVPPEADLPHASLQTAPWRCADGRRSWRNPVQLTTAHALPSGGESKRARESQGSVGLTRYAHSQAGCSLNLNRYPTEYDDVWYWGHVGQSRPSRNREGKDIS